MSDWLGALSSLFVDWWNNRVPVFSCCEVFEDPLWGYSFAQNTLVDLMNFIWNVDSCFLLLFLFGANVYACMNLSPVLLRVRISFLGFFWGETIVMELFCIPCLFVFHDLGLHLVHDSIPISTVWQDQSYLTSSLPWNCYPDLENRGSFFWFLIVYSGFTWVRV